ERLIQIGIHSLKIEGRTKSFYYCARTAQVYRKAIDDATNGTDIKDRNTFGHKILKWKVMSENEVQKKADKVDGREKENTRGK
ncbi:MAG: U32 family peptidase, partial [Arsenophonus sp. ER-EMS1-MAG3]